MDDELLGKGEIGGVVDIDPHYNRSAVVVPGTTSQSAIFREIAGAHNRRPTGKLADRY